MNPFETFAWVHQRFFPESPLPGHTILAIVGAFVGAFLLGMLSMAGADRFREKHSQSIVVKTPPPLPQDQSFSVKATMGAQADVVRSDLKTPAGREMIRKELRSFSEQGKDLQSALYNSDLSDPASAKMVQEWSDKISEFIEAHMSDKYLNAFRSTGDIPEGLPAARLNSATKKDLWQSLNRSTTRLTQFLSELTD